MRRIALYITTILIFLSLEIKTANAASSIAYIGADLDQNETNTIQTQLGTQNTKYMSIETINSLLSTSLQGSVLDGISMTNNPALMVAFIKNDDTTIDPKGYATYLISLNILSGDTKVVNHVTTFSLAENLQAYNDLGNAADTHFIGIFTEEQKIYQELLQDQLTPEQISSLFFDIQKASMAIPQTKSDTVAAVTTSIAREKVTISSNRKDELYTWAYDFVNAGNTAKGFFRDINISTDTSGNVIITSRPLFNAPHASNVNGRQKLAIFLTFLFLVLVGIYTIYRSKQKNKVISTSS